MQIMVWYFQGIRLYEEVGLNTDIVIENLVGEMYLNAAVYKFTMSIIFKEKV